MVVISCTKVGLPCQKLLFCMKICENVLVFGHYAINLHKGVAIILGNRVSGDHLKFVFTSLENLLCVFM